NLVIITQPISIVVSGVRTKVPGDSQIAINRQRKGIVGRGYISRPAFEDEARFRCRDKFGHGHLIECDRAGWVGGASWSCSDREQKSLFRNLKERALNQDGTAALGTVGYAAIIGGHGCIRVWIGDRPDA